jgi:geranylgeranyl reductase family protein
MRSHDLLVVGAGPAGSAAAITAAGLGLDVLVVDKATFPRDKTCGDGLTTAALRTLEALGLPWADVETSAAVVRETVVRSPRGRTVRLPLPEDGVHAAVVARRDLDVAVRDLAARRGAEVVDGVALRDLDPDDGGAVAATLDDGTRVLARALVAADGHYSTVRALLGRARPEARPRLGEWHAARRYVSGVADDRLWILFDPDLLPGYAWVFPLPGGRANVGFGVVRVPGRRGRDLRRLGDALLERPSVRGAIGPDARADGPVRAWPIPTRLDVDALTDGPVLFAGDAIGAVDPMTGEGIAQALETGILAARSVAAGGTAAAVGARYRGAVARALGADLRVARALQAVVRSPLGVELAIRAAGATSWTRRNFARWLFEDYPRAVLATPSRWRRGMLAGPGAFGASGVAPLPR